MVSCPTSKWKRRGGTTGFPFGVRLFGVLRFMIRNFLELGEATVETAEYQTGEFRREDPRLRGSEFGIRHSAVFLRLAATAK